MPVLATMVFLLLLPFGLWWMGDVQSAGFVGLFVFFTIPSMIQICDAAYKDKAWPRIVSGPSIQFGRKRKSLWIRK